MKTLICLLFALCCVFSFAAAEPIDLFGGIMRMDLPEGFDTMPENIVKIKYPDGNQPKYLYSNAQASSVISVKYQTEAVCPPAHLEQVKRAMEQGLPGMGENFRWVKQGYATINGNKWAVLEYISLSQGVEVHSILLLTSMADRLLIVNMRAAVEDFGKVSAAYKKTIRSLKI